MSTLRRYCSMEPLGSYELKPLQFCQSSFFRTSREQRPSSLLFMQFCQTPDRSSEAAVSRMRRATQA
jgi:hypothetical protein